MKGEVLQDATVIANLNETWQRLWKSTDRAFAFTHPAWLAPWWSTLGKGQEPNIAVLRDDEALQAVAPLARTRTALGPVLRPAGQGVSDYSDWLLPDAPVERSTAIDALADTIVQQCDWVGFELQGWKRLDDARALVMALDDRGLTARLLPGLVCPYVDMRDGFAAYFRTRGSQSRYNIRSRERRLRQHGSLRFDHVSADDAPRVVEEAMALHARRWAGQRTSTVFSSSAAGRSFYRAALPAALRAGFGDLVAITLNGCVVAAAIGLFHAAEYGYYLPAWHPGYAPFAPSTLLLAHILEHAAEHGAKRLDFMLGDEPYKAAWATGRERVHTVIASRPVPNGRLWLARTLVLSALKERARRSPRLMAIRRHGLRAVLRGPTDER